jgi:processive 1,2-diacylglycerol beta-glucosyltransferase
MTPTFASPHPPRVLLLSASSGAGHVRAAQALEKALQNRGGCHVEHIDVIENVSKLFQKLYHQAYIAMVRRAPDLMGFLYDRMDQPWSHPRRRLALSRLNTRPKRKLRSRNAIVVTDYDVHAMWLCRTVDRYYLAMPESAEYLAGVGVPREELCVTGIPIDPSFEKPVDKYEARLSAEGRVLLVSAGGYSIGPVEQLVKDLLATERPWQIVTVAGRSERLQKRLNELANSVGNCLTETRGWSPWASRAKWTSIWRLPMH